MSRYLSDLVFLGAAIQLVGILSYIRDTLRGETRPNRMTWLMWSIAPMIGTAAAFSTGVRWSFLPVFMSGFGPMLVFMASFVNRKAYWKLEPLDYLCGIFSLLALVMWGVTKVPEVAIFFAVISDGFAALPTVIKSWKHPESESAGAYIATLVSLTISLPAVQIWNFSSMAFPVYLAFINAVIAFPIICRIYMRKFHGMSD
jgi:hypothetical protein